MAPTSSVVFERRKRRNMSILMNSTRKKEIILLALLAQNLIPSWSFTLRPHFSLQNEHSFYAPVAGNAREHPRLKIPRISPQRDVLPEGAPSYQTILFSSLSPEEEMDQFLSQNDLRSITKLLVDGSKEVKLTRDRFISIFDSIENRTSDPSENHIEFNPDEIYPAVSPARSEMTDTYAALKAKGHLKIFGAHSNDNFLAQGSKIVTPTLLEEVLGIKMSSLTPRPTNTLLIAGAVLATVEGVTSIVTGIDFSLLALATLLLSFLDKIVLNGAVFEFFQRTLMPAYSQKVLRHEAGHFLVAYLLGCPVEGCVLSPLAALRDLRFAGTVSAGTSFFDKNLSLEVNGRQPLTRSSIDRFSMVVMGGISAEAIHFGQADGGAGDEMALVRFLTQITPRGGGAAAWDGERIKNQARWGALQDVLLIRQYRHCYEALCDALERGGSLGECVYAIEKAARDKSIDVLTEPMGVILDRGEYGTWVTSAITSSDASATDGTEDIFISDCRPQDSLSIGDNANNGATVLVDKDGKDDIGRNEQELAKLSEEEILKKYKAMMEKKLRDIDDKLGML